MPHYGFRPCAFLRANPRSAALAVAALVLSVPGARVALAADLAPHRAIYDLTLDEATDRSGISGAEGRIVYDVDGSSCEGYASSFRLVLRIFDTRGNSHLTDLQTSSYESKDNFNFTVRTFADGVPTEDTLGVARHENGGVAVELKKPEAESFTLSGDALFPYEHTKAIIARAEAGEHLLEAPSFDGSEGGRAIYSTLTVIGDPIDKREADESETSGKTREKRDDPAAVAEIGEVPGWPVTVSFYAADAPMAESEPVYEISFIQYANGVTRRMRLDYGDFSVAGIMTDIDYHDPAEPCPGQ